MFNIRDPRKFYVYPGVSGSAYVEVVYSKNPTNLSAGTDLIQVDDIFANALINFVLYRAFLKESEYAANVAVASGYFNAVVNQTLLVGKQIEQLNNPKTEAIVASFDSLITDVLPYVPGCPDSLIELNIRAAAIELCEKSKAFTFDLDPITTISGTYEYEFDQPSGTDVHQILWATYDGT